MDDGHFFSIATVLLGVCLLVFVGVTAFLVYILATKRDQEITARENSEEGN